MTRSYSDSNLPTRHSGMDHLEGELMSELENARLVRLLAKFGFINERPECVPKPPNINSQLKTRNPAGSRETHDGARLGIDTLSSFSVIMYFIRSTSVGDPSSAFRMCFHASTRYAILSIPVSRSDGLMVSSWTRGQTSASCLCRVTSRACLS